MCFCALSVLKTFLNYDGEVVSVNGPVVKCHLPGCFIFEVIYLSDERLVSEVISIQKEIATVQCYEDTNGLRVGDKVMRSHNLLSVECGPGLLSRIIDGVARPLNSIADQLSSSPSLLTRSRDMFIPKGVSAQTLDHQKLYDIKFNKNIKVGDFIVPGDVFAITQENELIECRMMLPDYGYDQNNKQVPCQGGKVTFIEQDGKYNIEHVSLKIQTPQNQELYYKLYFNQPVRTARPYQRKLTPKTQLISGQRVLDGLFPVARGSTACIPGAFGCGKTVISHSVAKYSNVDIVVYTACGERGNECSEILQDFPTMKIQRADGFTSNLMNRTILIANTSNMPVAAREASIYTAITIAEYFRDMGYNVALMADSTSRWAEAMREIAARMNELPSEGGYPSGLQSKLAQFYERGGEVVLRGKGIDQQQDRVGSITIIGAVSPQGGDFSDPVATSTLSIVNVFWALSKTLAKKKHFPSIDCKLSYTRCKEVLQNPQKQYREQILDLLQQNTELQETAQLVGFEALGDEEKLIIAVCKTISEGFLQQNGFTPFDSFCPFEKTVAMMGCLVRFYEIAKNIVANVGFEKFQRDKKSIWSRLDRMKEFNPRTMGIDKILEELKKLQSDIEDMQE